MESTYTSYSKLLASLPKQVRNTAKICSIPHWIDDDLAYSLVKKFSGLNGQTEETVEYLKTLPVVYPYESRGWRIVGELRVFLHEQIMASNSYNEISSFLVEEFTSQLNSLSTNSSKYRELKWRASYHLASYDPKKSIENLDELLKFTNESEQLSDLKAVVDLCNEQNRWLSDYEADTAYFQGRYYYALGNYSIAEDWLEITWQSDRDTLRKATAGHLLGVIKRKSEQHEKLIQAEAILHNALEIFEIFEERYGEIHVRNSLAATLRDLGGEKRLHLAKDLLGKNLSFIKNDNRKSLGITLLTLASTLIKLDPIKHESEILKRLKDAKRIGTLIHEPEFEYSALNIKAELLSKKGKFIKANEFLEKAKDIIHTDIKLYLKKATYYIKAGEEYFENAEREIRSAYEVAPDNKSLNEKLEYIRTLRKNIAARESGKIEASYDLGKAYDKDGQIDRAARCYEMAIQAGDDRPVVKYKLGRLLVRNKKRIEEGVKLLQESVNEGRRDHRILASLARSLQMISQYEKAEKYFDEALSKDDDESNPHLLNWYGLFLLEVESNYESAYRYIKKSFELMPNHPHFANDVGRVIIEAEWEDKYNEARDALELAIELTDKKTNFQWPSIYLEKLNELEKNDN